MKSPSTKTILLLVPFCASVAAAPQASSPATAAVQLSASGVPTFGPGDTGNIYATQSLIGEIIPHTVDTSDSAIVTNYQLEQAPQALRGSQGGTKPDESYAPDTSRYDKLVSDVFASPGTDAGDVPNAQWPMGLSHNRLGLNQAGWARQQNVAVLPAATEMAGVDMRLSPNAYRELHWHSASEWAFVMAGSVRVQSSNSNGETYIDDLSAGDVWFFPAGVPHSLQALEDGVEFLLVFDNGSFSEEDTLLVSELFLRNPRAVLAKNFKTDVSSFSDIPTGQLYIFPGTPAPTNISEQNVTGPAGAIVQPSGMYTYHFSQQEPLVVPGAGSVKIIDPTVFPAAADFSAALVTIQPGAMRELHWHLDSDEWNFFLEGQARITIFTGPQSSRTFDYAAGDVGYIPVANSHYIENTGTEDVVLLEVLRAPKFTDISVAQWLGLTSPQIVKDTLNLPDDVIANLPKYKPYLIAGDTNLTSTNFTATFSQGSGKRARF